jgi:hypothetical protein
MGNGSSHDRGYAGEQSMGFFLESEDIFLSMDLVELPDMGSFPQVLTAWPITLRHVI